ncbi:MAG: hypothetical protein Tsb002_20940 [Wenzhouxiangellaceae bacterium]
MNLSNIWLLLAGSSCIMVSLLHVAIIVGGADWYRFFGAGERMALMAENGSLYPALVTGAIALLFAGWAALAFAADRMGESILIKAGLIAVTAIFLLRGLLGFAVIGWAQQPWLLELQARPMFLMVSSLVCLLIGLVLAAGVADLPGRISAA